MSKTIGDLTIQDIHGRKFERALLWLILNDKDISQRIGSRIDFELFQSEQAREIMLIFSQHFARTSTPATSIIISSELKQRLSKLPKGTKGHEEVKRIYQYLFRLMKMKAPTDEDKVFIQDKTKEYITRRAIFNAIEKSADHFMNEDYDQIVSTLIDAVAYGDKIIAPSVGVDAYGSFGKKLARYQKRVTAGKKYPLDIKIIDNIMRGGMEPGKLAMFMGPSGRGKTLALVHTGACALRRGYSVAHVTLEISALEVEARYDSRFTKVPINSLLDDTLKYGRKLIQVQRRIKSSLFIKEWGTHEATLNDLRAYLDVLRMQTGKTPDVLIVDYADLFVPTTNFGADGTRFGLAQIVRGLRSIAEDFECAVWTASQTNKASFAARQIRMQDVAECVEKVNIADIIIGLCQTESEKRKGLLRLAMLKNRLGGKEGTLVDCFVSTDTQTIRQNINQTSQKNLGNRGGRP